MAPFSETLFAAILFVFTISNAVVTTIILGQSSKQFRTWYADVVRGRKCFPPEQYARSICAIMWMLFSTTKGAAITVSWIVTREFKEEIHSVVNNITLVVAANTQRMNPQDGTWMIMFISGVVAFAGQMGWMYFFFSEKKTKTSLSLILVTHVIASIGNGIAFTRGVAWGLIMLPEVLLLTLILIMNARIVLSRRSSGAEDDEEELHEVPALRGAQPKMPNGFSYDSKGFYVDEKGE